MKIDHTSWMFGYIIGAVVAFVMAHWLIEPAAYKRGQIDAVQGKVNFVLKTQADGSTKWEMINED